MSKVILWDFDGTLAYQPGIWAGAIMRALASYGCTQDITAEAVKPLLRTGFPWHTPDEAHPQLSTPEAWWRHMEGVLANVFVRLDFDSAASTSLAALTREHYVDPSTFQLFPGAIETLIALKGDGWRHAILSNHTPDLPALINALGISGHFTLCITSAAIGFEKPHPQAFRYALEAMGNPGQAIMIGDNPVADIQGASRVGIPSILVHSAPPEGESCLHAKDLHAIPEILAHLSFPPLT